MILNCVCGVSQHIRSAKAETGFSPCPESSDTGSRRPSFISILLKRWAVYPITHFILGFCSQSSVWLPTATIKDETVSDPERAARDFTRWGVTRGSEVNLCNSGICIQMTNDRIFLAPPHSPNFQCQTHEERRRLPLPRQKRRVLRSWGTLFHINLKRRSATSFAKLYHCFCPALSLFVAFWTVFSLPLYRQRG